MRLVVKKSLTYFLREIVEFYKIIEKYIIYPMIKRLFDILFASIAIIIFLPIMAIVAIMIKYKSPKAPILFKQERLGLNGEIFTIYKFRTMIPNAQEILNELMEKDENIKNEYLKFRNLKNDPRVIPVIGEFLRKSSLDELPQFFNILLGDMSLIGPRPYMESEFSNNDDKKAITRVKPGVTGLWQTQPNRHDTTFQERVDKDKKYIMKRNLLMDSKIVINTFGVMIGREFFNIYR